MKKYSSILFFYCTPSLALLDQCLPIFYELNKKKNRNVKKIFIFRDKDSVNTIKKSNLIHFIDELFDIFLLPHKVYYDRPLVWRYQYGLVNNKKAIYLLNIRKTLSLERFLKKNGRAVLLSDLTQLKSLSLLKAKKSKINFPDSEFFMFIGLPHGTDPPSDPKTSESGYIRLMQRQVNFTFSKLENQTSNTNLKSIAIPRHSAEFVSKISSFDDAGIKNPKRTIVLYSKKETSLRLNEKYQYFIWVMNLAKAFNNKLIIVEHPKEQDDVYAKASSKTNFHNFEIKKINPLSLPSDLNFVISFGSSIDYDVVIKKIPIIELHDYREKSFLGTKRSYFNAVWLSKCKEVSKNIEFGITNHAFDYPSLLQAYKVIQQQREIIIERQLKGYENMFKKDENSSDQVVSEILNFLD